MSQHLSLRKTTEDDLELLFLNQTDEEGIYMAAFVPGDPFDKEAYMTKWKRFLKDETINAQTIVLDDGRIAGSVGSYVMFDELQITYWIGKEFWGKGIATDAVLLFLKSFGKRPLYGRCAADNSGSIRVLEKCGFERVGTDKGFANARKAEIEEFVYLLK